MYASMPGLYHQNKSKVQSSKFQMSMLLFIKGIKGFRGTNHVYPRIPPVPSKNECNLSAIENSNKRTPSRHAEGGNGDAKIERDERRQQPRTSARSERRSFNFNVSSAPLLHDTLPPPIFLLPLLLHSTTSIRINKAIKIIAAPRTHLRLTQPGGRLFLTRISPLARR